MIKTMLLTAQLALSPIVGTNGLQPKQLPNPVYGESVDYSVKYDGRTYTRWGYNKQKQFGFEYIYKENPILGFEEGNTNTWTINQATFSEANIVVSKSMYYYIDPGKEDWDWEYNTCFSYWLETEEGFQRYLEFFYHEAPTTEKVWECHMLSWEQNGTFEGEFWYKDQAIQRLELTENYSIYFYETDWKQNSQELATKRIIPAEQPTIDNPSVYDNIYNFYYENLFANEALDEMGAEVGNNSMTMRQWLAHTATIVSISLLAVALAVLVIKIFKLIAGSISDIWG